MELKNELTGLNNRFVALFFIAIFWFSLITFSGTMTSGFHFTDDHQIITLKNDIKEIGFFSALKSIVASDLHERFRPFYFVHRVLLSLVLGSNFIVWSIYNIILAIATSYFLFLFVYKQGYRFSHSLLFPFLTLIGSQTAVWWRLGPAETLGIFLLSTSLLTLLHSVLKSNKTALVISIAFLILASLTKESFLLFVPAFILIMIYLDRQLNSNNISFSIRKYKVSISFIFLFLLGEVLFITYFVGTNKIDYAGVDSSFDIINFLKFCNVVLRTNVYGYLILFGLFLILQTVESWKKIFFTHNYFTLIFNFVILLSIILPQLILYNKSWIYERYLLPINLGFALFVIFLLEYIYKHASISLFTKRIFFSVILLNIFLFFKRDTLPSAQHFTNEGIVTNRLLTEIISNTNENDSVLVVLNGYENYELGFSLNYYLRFMAERKNVLFHTIDSESKNPLEAKLQRIFFNNFKSYKVKSIAGNFSCIVVLPFRQKGQVTNTLDKNSLYRRNDYDNLILYSRNL